MNNAKKLFPLFSDNFDLGKLSRQIKTIRYLLPSQVDGNNISDVLAYNQEKLKYAERLSNLLKEIFC